MGLIPPFVGAIIFTIVQFIVFLFVLIATPISQMDRYGGGCYTMWGYKSNCGSTTYTARGKAAFLCAERRNNMNGAAAFALFSIFTTLIALIFGIMMLLKKTCPVVVPLIFTWLSAATILISWACVAGARINKMCGNLPGGKYSFKYYTSYGAGFGLMVTAWCFQVLNAILLTIIACS